jgi:hypothetical protein
MAIEKETSRQREDRINRVVTKLLATAMKKLEFADEVVEAGFRLALSGAIEQTAEAGRVDQAKAADFLEDYFKDLLRHFRASQKEIVEVNKPKSELH